MSPKNIFPVPVHIEGTRKLGELHECLFPAHLREKIGMPANCAKGR